MRTPATPSDQQNGDTFGLLLRLIGADALLVLIEARGGTRLPIPTYAKADAQLGRLIGLSALASLVRELGGTHVNVPLAKHWRIKLYRQQALSLSAIARLTQVTESTVSRVLQGMGLAGSAPAAEPGKGAAS